MNERTVSMPALCIRLEVLSTTVSLSTVYGKKQRLVISG